MKKKCIAMFVLVASEIAFAFMEVFESFLKMIQSRKIGGINTKLVVYNYS